MIILGIETSCDDTGIALLEFKNKKFKILSNVVSSQINLHKEYGGVFPSLAKREHLKNLPIVLKKALKKANNPKPDLIAVTKGPGLEPCLWTGINFAKELKKQYKIPLVPINHIEAHILINLIDKETKNIFPSICLIVSGGHTQLALMKKLGHYKIIGETRDDAAGECFDKAARILGLSYPGGPEISKLASKIKESTISLPRPMINQKNYDFSFSGLKTAILYDSKKNKKTKRYIMNMAFEIQRAIIDVLLFKTEKAVKNHKAKSVILGGGVTANKELRKRFKNNFKNIELMMPDANFSTDNAVMVAAAAGIKNQKKDWKNIQANANLRLGS